MVQTHFRMTEKWLHRNGRHRRLGQYYSVPWYHGVLDAVHARIFKRRLVYAACCMKSKGTVSIIVTVVFSLYYTYLWVSYHVDGFL